MEDGQRHEVESKLRLFVEQTTEHVLMLLDTEGRIVAWFRGAERSFGYSADEAIGQPFSMLFTSEGRAAGVDQYELNVAQVHTEAEDDRWMVRKNGSRFWAGGVLTAIRDADGRLLGFAKLLRDRTDVREQTETLKNQNSALQQTNERKNQFISTLAHELRNPLSSIVTAVELLKTGACTPDDVSLAVSILQREANSMRRLVDDLNEATRAEAGKVRLEQERQDLRPILESAIETCRPSLDPEHQKLHVVLPQVAAFVDVDAERMRQVFINLVQNAAAATRQSGTIWVKVTMEGNEAVVKIEDNGAGISPELIPVIFELFTQAESVPGQRQAGLGIGLSVVKNLTTLHGGSVQVRSDGLGKGSEFTVRLPLAE